MTRQHSKGDAVTRTSDPQGALTVSRFLCMPSKGVLRAQLHTVVYVSQEQNLPRDPCTGDSGATSWKGSQMCSPHPCKPKFQLKALGRRWLGEDEDVGLQSALSSWGALQLHGCQGASFSPSLLGRGVALRAASVPGALGTVLHN